VAMGGSLHDARLGFFGLSRARHGVHGLHGFCEHKNTLRTIQCLWLGVLSFKHKRCAMRRKITKPRECEKNNKCSSGSCKLNCFVYFQYSWVVEPPGKLTFVCIFFQKTLHGARRKGACTMHDKHYFNFHGARPYTLHDARQAKFHFHDARQAKNRR